MAHQQSVQVLASLFRASNEARPVLLLGAGASFSSGVPLAAESVRRLAKRVFAEKEKGGSLAPEHVKLAEWQPWLRSHPWYVEGEERLAENFPLVVQHLLVPREYRKKLLLDILEPTNGIGPGYKRLSELVMRGLVRTILTTNFDKCLPAALYQLQPHIRHVAEVNRGPDDLREFALFGKPQIVWLHGKAEQYTDRNLAGEVEKLDSKLVKLLLPMLGDSPLVVIGYRGAERSVMDSLLARCARESQKFHHGVYWCARPGDLVHPHVHALRRKIGDNFRHLEIAGFDEVMEDLARALRGEDLYPTQGVAAGGQNPLTFDDSPIETASLDELDRDLMLAVMRDYCGTLGRAPVTHETLFPLLREQGLLVSSHDREVPTIACLLLFGRDPQRRFPHAVVSATVASKKRIVFSGNLLQQRRALLEWLDEPEVNPVLRVKRRSTHEEKKGYATRALTELVVNMLVHRDYQIPEPASIDVVPGEAITFHNAGGLLESIAKCVNVEESGRFRPAPGISELRNRSLCDVFFGMRAMEREGTGLSDVERLASDAGGDATFASDLTRRTFSARLAQPVSSAGSSRVARDGRPTGVYVFNVLRFAALPERLSIVRLNVPLRKRPSGIELDGLGTFIERGDELWSFVAMPKLRSVLGPVAHEAESRECTRADMETREEDRKVLSWLLRKHFERHLSRFAGKGLVLEQGPRRRAYFVGEDGHPRAHVYDTPHKRRVSRLVVKQRSDLKRAWFENEGFGFEVVQVDGCWAVRIKPFYMFTSRDARTPLPAFTRAARATRRMKMDRNKNVEDDLTFWGRFLSDGSPNINIGQENVDDLLLEGTFMTIEVAEEGLLNEHSDRVSA